MKGLYIHIPFCVKKCSYCDFYSLPVRTDTIESYVQAVLKEANSFPLSQRRTKGDFSLPLSLGAKRGNLREEEHLTSQASFQTLYIGGGTPSILGPKNLTALITGLSKIFTPVGSGLEPDRPAVGEESSLGLAESNIELNPESATPQFLQTVKDLGFTRLSFGVQSLNDKELQSVGRIHTAAQAIAAIKLAKKLDLQSISADLIIGLPGQTWTSLHYSLQTLVGMGIQHLSVYCLSLEAGTPLGNNPPPDLPTDDLQAALFEETRNYLITCGFAHYEISNFALPRYECLHNLNYWRGGEYLGLGTAAASHLNGERFKNRTDLDAYLENPTGQIEDVEELDPKEKAAEEAMLRLRLLEEGLNTDELTAKFGSANTSDIIRCLDKMVQEGLLLQTGSACRLEPSRILTSNPIFARVLED